jgi:hypothetical protein
MAIKVNNFNIGVDQAKIKIDGNYDLYIRVVEGMEGKFFMDSDMSYNTVVECTNLNYVFFVDIDWKEHTMSIGLCPKGHGSTTQHSWSVPINKDVMKTSGTFLNYLKLCVVQKDIMTTYLNG